MNHKLLDAVIVDTTGTGIVHQGGAFTIQIQSSSFGGGTVKIQGSLDGTNYVSLPTAPDNSTLAEYTANTMVRGILNQSTYIRAVLTGSTTPAALTVTYCNN